jgi:hypothetical protein
VSQRTLRRIRKAVHERRYDFSVHAREEAMVDALTDKDMLHVLKTGNMRRTEYDDPRGERYTIVGTVEDRSVGVVGRFVETGVFLIITAYEIKDLEEV